MVYFIQLASKIRTELQFRPVRARKLSLKPVRKTPDDGLRNCPKHVQFYSKNKLEKLVHLFGFIIRNYHEARSPKSRKLVSE